MTTSDDDRPAPPLTRREAALQTRDQLLLAGAAEFSRHGLAGARIQAITKAAGVALGTFYNHFKDKDALFEAVIAKGGELFLENLAHGLAVSSSPKERDWAAIDRAVAFAESQPDLFRMLMAPGALADATRNALAQMIVDVRRAQYPQGKAQGLFWPELDEQIAAIAETGVVFVVLNWWMENPEKASRAEVVAALVNLRRYGVERPPADGPDFITAADIRAFEKQRSG